jgi:Uma2 family endonuclease
MLSPFDIILKNEKETNRVQPDISVICDKSGFNELNYVGIPSLMIEVLSPSTMSKDFIKKMDLYMRFGVQEYWIVSPKNKEIQIFVLEEGSYSEMISYKENDILESVLFNDLKINLKEIFS